MQTQALSTDDLGDSALTAAKDYTSIKVKIEYATSGGKLYVDDVSLVQTN